MITIVITEGEKGLSLSVTGEGRSPSMVLGMLERAKMLAWDNYQSSTGAREETSVSQIK